MRLKNFMIEKSSGPYTGEWGFDPTLNKYFRTFDNSHSIKKTIMNAAQKFLGADSETVKVKIDKKKNITTVYIDSDVFSYTDDKKKKDFDSYIKKNV